MFLVFGSSCKGRENELVIRDSDNMDYVPSVTSVRKCFTITFLFIKDINQYLLFISIHKRMVRFQKLTRNLFLTLHGPNVHRQQR